MSRVIECMHCHNTIMLIENTDMVCPYCKNNLTNKNENCMELKEQKSTFFSFKGRMTRLPYFAIISTIIILEYLFLFAFVFSSLYLFLIVIFILDPMIWSFIVVKRCHDINLSGWYILLSLVPIANVWLGFCLLFNDGTHGPNRFGADSKNRIPVQPTDKYKKRHNIFVIVIGLLVCFLLVVLGVFSFFVTINEIPVTDEQTAAAINNTSSTGNSVFNIIGIMLIIGPGIGFFVFVIILVGIFIEGRNNTTEKKVPYLKADKTIYKVKPIDKQKQVDISHILYQKPEINYPIRQTGIGPSAMCSRCGNETSFLRYFAFGGQMLTCAICGFKGRVMKDSIGKDVII